MATTTINGVTAYQTAVNGNDTYYIRVDALTTEENEWINAVDDAKVAADLRTELQDNVTWDATGQTGWEHFSGYEQRYNAGDARHLLSTSFTVADTSVGMTQAELDDLVARLNAIQTNVDVKK